MADFDDRNEVTPAEEISYYLNNSSAADEEEQQAAEEKARLEKIADETTRSHSDVLTMMIIAFVILFFGTVFTALTNEQDFSENESFSLSKLVSGDYFNEIEEKFNKQLPLQDQFHNASSAIKYCFGVGNELDIIDIDEKRSADDPYSIRNDNEYIPISDNSDSDDSDEKEVSQKTLPEIVTTSNNKNKKLTGIKMTTVMNEDEMNKETYDVQPVDRNAPPGYHDPGFSPFTDAQETQPSETQPSETQPTQSSDTNFFVDPGRKTTPSETAPPQPDVSTDASGDPSDTLPSETNPVDTSSEPPATSSNQFFIPAVR